VLRDHLPETVVATGTTDPLARVVVQSEIPGIVAAIHVDDGERVAHGAPLVELDRERIAYRVAELRAALAVREAQARQDLAGSAVAQLEQVRRDHGRIASMYKDGIVAQRELDDVRHRLRLAEIGVSDARAEKAAREAAVMQAMEALRQAERDLEKSVIRAPVSGLVLHRAVEVGAAVADLQNGGTVVAILADDSRIHVTADVDERDIARVRLGQIANVRIDAFPGEQFSGTVRKVSSSATAAREVRNFPIEIELPPDPRMRVGMSADVRVVVRDHRDVLVVPNTAIVRTPEGPRIRVAHGGRGRFELRLIREGYSDGFRTIVAEGLSETDELLVAEHGERR
jgi:RND family efflux transporter MFP subunit